MSFFNSTFFILPVLPPSVDTELCDNVTVTDDRVKIAEAEAAFDEFESKLSAQLYRHLSPPGRRPHVFTSGVDDIVTTTGCGTQRTPAGRGNLQSPLYNIVESLNLDSELNEMDLSNTSALGPRASGSRLPRRVVTSRLSTSRTSATQSFSPHVPPLYGADRSTTVPQITDLTGGDLPNSFVELTAASISRSVLNTGNGEADGIEDFLADEDELEHSGTIDELNET